MTQQSSATTAITFAAISGAIVVALGAFGAHALRDQLDAYGLQIWQTAVQYQMFHTLAIVACGLLLNSAESKHLVWAWRCFAIGIAIFSGTLYVLALSGIKWLGAVTPLGGMAFLAGWLLLAIASRNLLARPSRDGH